MRAFDEAAGTYDDWYGTENGRQVFSAERRLLERLLPGRVVGLEIGAGTGAFAEALSGLRHIVCLDLSHGMLARASDKGLPCILGSADKMPLRDDAFDFAYMVTVMEFLTDPVAALVEASRVTTSDASIVTLTINAESGWGRFYASMAAKGDPIFSHARLYTPAEVGETGEKAGLHKTETLGTLTTDPASTDAGGDIVKPSAITGVVATKFTKS